MSAAPVDITGLLAEEALYLGASFAHIAAYNHTKRMARIQQQGQIAARSFERRTNGRASR